MTRLASFEAGEGKKSMAIGSYFRGDYIAKEIVKSIIYGTVTFAIILDRFVATGHQPRRAGVCGEGDGLFIYCTFLVPA